MKERAMKQFLSTSIAILLLCSLAHSRPGPRGAAQLGKVEQELLFLEREWDDAIVRRDVAALERIVSDDFILVDAEGAVSTKKQLIEGIKTSEAEIEPFNTEDVRVRVYGDTAVTTGRFTQKIRYRGKEYVNTFRYTDVYVKIQGRWRGVAEQPTRW